MKDCPDKNEFGVRDDPVCIDEVDTEIYQNITGGFDLIESSELISVSGNAVTKRVRAGCLYHTSRGKT